MFFGEPAACVAYYIWKYEIVSRCRIFEFSLKNLPSAEGTQSLFSGRARCTRDGPNFITEERRMIFPDRP